MGLMDDAHALIVGIADYQHINRLPKVRDAGEIAQVLVDPVHCGYRPENVMTLLDADANQAAIRQGLATLADRCTKDSTALIYFSGHGGRIESGPHAGEYLLPVDTIYPKDEDLARTAISGDEFTAALAKIQARKVLVVFDCCHSGGIGQPRDIGAAPVKPGLSDNYYEQAQGREGTSDPRIVAAGRVLLRAGWAPTYGLFTEHLLGGLKGGVASDDGLVRIFDLFEYLQPRVTKAHPRQHPLFKGELEENFPVALYRGGAKGVVPTVEGDFRYDAYISYVDKGADAEFVWDTLVPKLEGAGLKLAVSGDSVTPGVPRIVGGGAAIRQSKRTVVVLSEAVPGRRHGGLRERAGPDHEHPGGDVSPPAREDLLRHRGASSRAPEHARDARPDPSPTRGAQLRAADQGAPGTVADEMSRADSVDRREGGTLPCSSLGFDQALGLGSQQVQFTLLPRVDGQACRETGLTLPNRLELIDRRLEEFLGLVGTFRAVHGHGQEEPVIEQRQRGSERAGWRSGAQRLAQFPDGPFHVPGPVALVSGGSSVPAEQFRMTKASSASARRSSSKAKAHRRPASVGDSGSPIVDHEVRGVGLLFGLGERAAPLSSAGPEDENGDTRVPCSCSPDPLA